MFIIRRPMRVFSLLAICLFGSCATSPHLLQRDLLGQWRYSDPAQSCRYVFSPDSTFRADVAIHGKTVARFTGRWSVKGDVLLYEYLTDERGEIAPGSTDHDQLLSVQKDYFIIKAADGSQRRYDRVQRKGA